MNIKFSDFTAIIQRLVTTAIAVAVLMPITSQAQETAVALDEILVTATRRAEGTDIQTTPISVSVVNDVQLDRLNARDLLGVAPEAPNVVAGKQPGFNSANWAIRGVGQASIILYFESQVGTIVDDFVIPHIQTANIEMLDLESVEILRGPQGTLFGKNTTGGVVNVRTKPADLEEGSFELRGKVAEFGRTEWQAILNVPFADNWAFRASGTHIKSDGYFENSAAYGPITTFCAQLVPCGATAPGDPFVIPGITGTSGQGDGSDIGGDDVFSGRFKLRWQPTDDLNMNLTYEIVRDQGDTPVSTNGTPNNTAYLWNALGFSADLSGDQTKQGAVSNREDNLLQMGSRGHEIDVDGYYFNLDWSFSDNYTLAGIVGYRETDSWLPNTYTGAVYQSLFDANRQDHRETTQVEARIASNYDGAFNWLIGGFYQQDDTIFTVAQSLGFVDLIGGPAANGIPVQNFFNPNPQVMSNGQDAESYALFLDGIWNVSDRWTLEGGVRWTHEEKDWTGRVQVFPEALQTSVAGVCNPFFFAGPTYQELGEPLAAADFARWDCGVLTNSKEWDEPTWRLAASYQATDSIYTYFSYARGFKSGGYNDQSGTEGFLEPIQTLPTDPETADSFELGLRSDLLDDTLRFNVSGFYVIYDDMIQPIVVSTLSSAGILFEATRFFNAAEATVYGIELESTWVATERFSIRGNLGWLHAEFDSFEVDTDLDGTIDVDLSGQPVARAPELDWGIYFLYEWPLSGGSNLELAADVNYEDEAVFTYTAVPGTPNGTTDDRTLLNASVTWTSADDRIWARVYGKNLTDEAYRIGELPVGGLWVMSYWAEPRVIGAEAGVKFGW
jgi:iron complex outermembrane receptor protein